MTNSFIDKSIFIESLNGKELCNLLSLQTIKEVLTYLKIDYTEVKTGLICKTACHHKIDEECSKKLYYYEDSKMFFCFTQCDAMNLISFYQHYHNINYEEEIDYNEALTFVKSFLIDKDLIKQPQRIRQIYENRYLNKIAVPKVQFYDERILTLFQDYLHPEWKHDGITEESIKKFNIKFSQHYNQIIIPHYNVDGKLIGIRCRAISDEDILLGKYRPFYHNNKIYNHPLSYNLYGIYEHKDAIKKLGTAIVVEGEKSCLLEDQYYQANAISVATCGNRLSRAQILLLNELGVSEIIIAFDKEYECWNSEKRKTYYAYLHSICDKYQSYAHFSFIIDKKNLLNEKDSPLDKGKEIFNELYQKRIMVN